MSTFKAKKAFVENVTRFIGSKKDPVAFNLNVGLNNLVDSISEIQSKLSDLERKLDAIERKLPR